jgi:hypothetical protein
MSLPDQNQTWIFIVLDFRKLCLKILNEHFQIWFVRTNSIPMQWTFDKKLTFELALRTLVGNRYIYSRSLQVILDWLIIEKILTWSYLGLADRLISYGPCQFPTLGFVVERYHRIENFVEEPFWSIKVTLKTEQRDSSPEGEAIFTWDRNRLFDRQIVISLYEMCVLNPLATVIDKVEKEKVFFIFFLSLLLIKQSLL